MCLPVINGCFKWVTIVLLLATAIGCGRSPQIKPVAIDPATVSLWVPESQAKGSSAAVRWFQQTWPSVPVVSMEADPSDDHAAHGIVWIVPVTRPLSATVRDHLHHHIERGGRVLIWEVDPMVANAPWPTTDDLVPPILRAGGVRYGMTLTQVDAVRRSAKWSLPATPAVGILGRPERLTDPSGASMLDTPTRWIPFFQGTPANGTRTADVAGVYLHAIPGMDTIQWWGWLGVGYTPEHHPFLRAGLPALVNALQRGYFLVGTYPEQATFRAGELFRLHAGVATAQSTGEALRWLITLRMPDGEVVRRVASPSFTLEGDSVRVRELLNAGVVPAVSQVADRYTLSVAVKVAGAPDRVWDRQAFEVMALSVKPPDQPPEPQRVAGGRLVQGRTPVFVWGPDYEPGLVPESDRGWLQPAFFPGGQVVADLEQIAWVGANLISLRYGDISEAPQLRYVIETARRLDLRVQIRLPYWIWHQSRNESAARDAFVDALKLRTDPVIAQLDLTPEPWPGSPLPDDFGPAGWSQWWTEQYGDGVAEGGLEHPPGAVVRRFASDTFSRALGLAVRRLRSEPSAPLITLRYPMPVRDAMAQTPSPYLPEPGVGAVHLDFCSLTRAPLAEGPLIGGDEALVTSWLQGISNGRPLVWTGLGAALGSDSVDGAQALQTGYEALFALQVSGGLWTRFAATDGESQAPDAGFVVPGGAGQPMGVALRAVGTRVREYRATPPPWRGREAAAGVSWATRLNEWAPQYEQELARGQVEPIRPAGFGVSTLDAVPTRLADKPTGPFIGLNAEWGTITVGGDPVVRRPGQPWRVPVRQPVRLELINTGYSHWQTASETDTRGVGVRVTHEQDAPRTLAVVDTPPGERVRLTWTPPTAGRYILRPHWRGFDDFGERLIIEVEE